MQPVESLLAHLCVELGFCLNPVEFDAIVANPPVGVERFAVRVWEAEGLEPPRSQDRVFLGLCKAIGEFPRTGGMRVEWPDGVVVAQVEVDSQCRPLKTRHVLGTFLPGPGFDRLTPVLQELEKASQAGTEALVKAATRV